MAILAAVLATVVGTAAAIGLNRLTGRLAGLMRTLLMVSIVTPGIVIAIAVYVSFLQWHLTGTLFGYVVAHAAIGVPFVLVSVTSAWADLIQCCCGHPLHSGRLRFVPSCG